VIEDRFEASECYELLKIADCIAANFLHPNDKRKIVNALFSYFKKDKSKVVRDKLQCLPILVWMEADRAVLEERVNRRIG
jgi:tRNA A37 N6-isopentenylltransferase MiaA